MDLITTLTDERLEKWFHRDEQEAILFDSLRAALEREQAYSRSILVDRLKELEKKLCAAREVVEWACQNVGRLVVDTVGFSNKYAVLGYVEELRHRAEKEK